MFPPTPPLLLYLFSRSSKDTEQPNNFPSILKITVIFTFFLITCVAAVHLQALRLNAVNNIYPITISSLDNAKQKFGDFLILFTSPDCTKCSDAKTAFEAEHTNFAVLNPSITLTTVDTAKDK